MLKSTPAYIKLKGKMIMVQSKLQQFLHLEKPSAGTPEEYQAAKFREVLINDQMTVSSKILFNQTLGLAVGLWSPIVLLVVSMMPAFMLFSFNIIGQLIRTQIQLLKSQSQPFDSTLGTKVAVDDTEAAEMQELRLQVAELQGAVLELQSLVPADAVLGSHLKSMIRNLQLDDDQIVDPRSPHPLISKREPGDPQSGMLAQVLIHGKFVSHIFVPLPNTRMKTCSVVLVWLSVLLVLIDFGFALGPWIAWGLLTVGHGAVILFYCKKQSSPHSDSPKGVVQNDAKTTGVVAFSAPSGVLVNQNPIANMNPTAVTLGVDQHHHDRSPISNAESNEVYQFQFHEASNSTSLFQNIRGAQVEPNDAPIRKKRTTVPNAQRPSTHVSKVQVSHGTRDTTDTNLIYI